MVWEGPEQSGTIHNCLGGFMMVWEGTGLFGESGTVTEGIEESGMSRRFL